MTTTVRLGTRTVGQCFGTQGVLLHPRTRAIVAYAARTRPYGFTVAAVEDAASLAAKMGLSVAGGLA